MGEHQCSGKDLRFRGKINQGWKPLNKETGKSLALLKRKEKKSVARLRRKESASA